MSKEMIISVNGREKKIAILDNGQVTEFYIERGEENSGVVGNIYKGRVQRVLPGMQSAFVEIGLERDAFLYVSDFFDEEEEIERIMFDKGKKMQVEEVDEEVTDQLHRARLEREKQMERAQEIAEPLAETIEPIEVEEVIEPEQPKGKRNKNRKNKKGRDSQNEEAIQTETVSENTLSDELIKPPFNFEIEDSGFERIVDEDDTTGEMFKDAYMQEAIVDQVRAIEFEMESTPTAEVGSFFEEVANTQMTFERIADEDEPVAQEAKSSKSKKQSGKSRRGGKPKVEASKSVAEVPEVAPEPVVVEEVKAEQPPIEVTKDEKNKKGAKKPAAESKNAKPNPESPTKKPSTKSKSKTKKTAEAGVKEPSEISEMAVRRGGRRRGNRRPNQRRNEGENVENQEFEGNEVTEESSSGYQNGNNKRRESRERSQPTITDLLREGQEILVQIAKEPIARKGARITSHIALPGRYLVYMPTIEHVGVSRKIESGNERGRLRTAIQRIRNEEDVPSGGFIVRTAGIGVPEESLRDDARYLVRTWKDIKKNAEKSKSPALVHQDLDLIQRILRDQLSNEYTAIRVDSEEEYLRIVEFVNRIQPKMVNRVKLYTRDEPILESYGVQEEVDKALKPRVWLKSGGYLVINQTEALVSIDVNTGKFVGKGNARLEDTITKTNMEAVEEIARQIRLRDLGGILVLDLIDMEDRRNRHKVMQALQEALSTDKSPTKVLSFNDFGLVIMTRKRVKQSLERTMCAPCSYCQGAGLIKSPQTVCYEILEESRRLSKGMDDVRQTTLRVNPEVAKALRGVERVVLDEIEEYLGAVDLTSDASIHQEQFDFAFI
ncbi:MAG: Rne/Rng family ribonuclease [Pyrinomonadaceae bacterium]|nr:Rne/Rng family ribonuclease [Pyrinomonadaceae bacterium]